ncbi:MAG: amidohydrolase [Chitinophagaceae bacterium]
MKILNISVACLFFLSCTTLKKVDLLVYNTKVYTVDASFSVAEAMAVNKGKIEATGSTAQLTKKYKGKQKIDANGKFIYPGFIDAHAHFLSYGLSLQTADLVDTKSWNEVLQRLTQFKQQKSLQPGQWLTGRGWDQNDWTVKEFPDKHRLDELFPENPVLLTRIDGHAAIANSKAFQLSNITAPKKITGGEIEAKNNQPTGILIDNAIGLVSSNIPRPDKATLTNALLDAQRNCFTAGLTTIDDCGVNASTVDLVKELQNNNQLKMRLYLMLSDNPANYDYLESKGIIKTNKLHVRGFKLYGDGALGSRGACLLRPYSDKPGSYGFLLSSPAHFDSTAARIYKNGFQMCTHAIGDSGNRVILKTYAKYLKGKNDLRWRIEHAQVVNEKDFKLFGQYNIIPSVQPTHATSDMYWAGERLGNQREKGAYAYKQLMLENLWMPLGTDFPVENISPFKTFYAAVFRQDAKEFPAGGYQMENALSRQDALRGMTIWAAKSNFEEAEKGSLQKGKLADFIILDKDLMAVPKSEILNAKVLMTFLNGEKVFEQK